MDIIKELEHTSGGMDGFLPQEMQLMSPKAASVLARMLNLIEQGAEWPEHLQHARAAFLAKDPND